MPNIEIGIRDRWSTDATLSNLIPVDRLFTNRAISNPAIPYAVLRRLDTAPQLRTSSRTAVDRSRIEITVWTDDLSTGMTLASQFADRFDQTDFTLTDGVVLNMKLSDFHHERADHALWKMTMTYHVVTEHTLQETA